MRQKERKRVCKVKQKIFPGKQIFTPEKWRKKERNGEKSRRRSTGGEREMKKVDET